MTNDWDGGVLNKLITFQKGEEKLFRPKIKFLGLAKQPKTTIQSKFKPNLKKTK